MDKITTIQDMTYLLAQLRDCLVDKSIEVLIADKSIVNLKVINSLCLKLGYTNVKVFMEPEEVLWHLPMRSEYRGIIIYNLNDERLNGVELIKKVKEKKSDLDVSFVFLTPASTPKIENYVKQLTKASFLIKPVSADKMEQCLKDIAN